VNLDVGEREKEWNHKKAKEREVMDVLDMMGWQHLTKPTAIFLKYFFIFTFYIYYDDFYPDSVLENKNLISSMDSLLIAPKSWPICPKKIKLNKMMKRILKKQ